MIIWKYALSWWAFVTAENFLHAVITSPRLQKSTHSGTLQKYTNSLLLNKELRSHTRNRKTIKSNNPRNKSNFYVYISFFIYLFEKNGYLWIHIEKWVMGLEANNRPFLFTLSLNPTITLMFINLNV